MITRYMWTIVCDDIRQEVGNKVSYVGVYAGELIVPTFPFTLPKLCALVNVTTDVEDPFKQLELLVYKDDQEIAKIEVSEAQVTRMLTSSRARAHTLAGSRSDGSQFNAGFVCQFVPLSLDRPCMLRFRAKTERETLLGGSVVVRAATASNQNEEAESKQSAG